MANDFHLVEPNLIVPVSKFKEIQDKGSSQTIVEKGTCRTFYYQNTEYVPTGGASGGGIVPVRWAYVVQDLSVYQGTLKPLKYHPHFEEVDNGNRDRSYCGMLLITGEKRQIVVVGPKVTFVQVDVGQQLTLF